ncbi:MAG: PqqD family protein [Phycisphaerae bacterium]|nr:PqqD family protein [Phycisphaerae bacterium]
MSAEYMVQATHDAPARRAGVRLYRVDDEAVLYDPAHDGVHYLNATALFIWERCDGRRAVEDIVEDLTDAFEQTDGGAHTRCNMVADVRNTLMDLSNNGLLDYAGR